MQTAYSLLITADQLSKYAKPIAIGLAAAILVIALIVGFVKGFSRIGWGAFLWASASAIFFGLEKWLHDKNPILKLNVVKKLDEGVQGFISTFSILFVAIIVSLIVYGIFALIFRPRRRKVDLEDIDDEDTDDNDEDEDEAYKRKMRIYGKRQIGIVNRIFGALTALISAVAVIFAVACILLVIINITPFKGHLNVVYGNSIVEKCWAFIHSHAFDFLFVGIIAGLCVSQYRGGLVGGVRSFVLTFGIFGAIVAAFVLPFFAGKVNIPLLGKLTDFFVEAVGGGNGGKMAIVGKLLTGLPLCAIFVLAVVLVGWLMKLLSLLFSKISILHFIDGGLAVLIMFAVGAAICALILALLYVFGFFGVFNATALFGESSTLARGAFKVMDVYLKPLLEKLLAMIGI